MVGIYIRRATDVPVWNCSPKQLLRGPEQYLVTPILNTAKSSVGLKIEIHEIHEIHQNLRNPVSILIKFHPLQQNMQRKVSKSDVSSNEINGFHEIQ